MELKIIDFDYKGRGVAKQEKKTIFLNGGIIGDTVEAKITEDKKKFSVAEVTKILEYSKDRVPSKCRYSKDCGGCDFLEYKYNKQLEWKKKKVHSDISRIGGIETEIFDTAAMKNPYYYRNNIQLKVKDGKLGYYKKNSKELVEIEECIIAKKEINKVIQILKNWKGLSSVDTISLRENHLGQVMMVLITDREIKKLNSLLAEVIDGNISVFENKNTNKKFRFGKNFKKLYGEDYLEDEISKMKFKLSPRSFFQVNLEQTEVLYKTALDYLELNEADRVLDLYCGIGTITLLAAKRVKEIVGVEIVEDAIEDARKNAELNNINNARFICGKSEDVIEKLTEEKLKFNKVILDPPRTGLDESVINTLLKIKPEKISYVSCNTSTQARDLKLLQEEYRVVKVQPVDMFCNSVHVESVVLLSRENS